VSTGDREGGQHRLEAFGQLAEGEVGVGDTVVVFEKLLVGFAQQSVERVGVVEGEPPESELDQLRRDRVGPDS